MANGVRRNDPISAIFHSELKRPLAIVDERPFVNGMIGHHGHPEAQSRRQDSIAIGDLELRNLATDAFCTFEGNFLVGTRQNDAEDLPVVPARDIFGPDEIREALTQFPEHLLDSMVALFLLDIRHLVRIDHHDADGSAVAVGRRDFTAQGFFHVAPVEQPREVIADAVLLEPDIQVLVCHIKPECRSDDADLRLPEVKRFAIGNLVELDRKDAEMFLEPFDWGAEGNSLGMMMQVGATTIHLVRGKIGNDNLAQIETGTFGGHDGIVTDDIVTKRKNLVQFRLRASIHVKDPGRSREKFGQSLFQGLHDLRERTVLENRLAENFAGTARFWIEAGLFSGGRMLSNGFLAAGASKG